MFKNILFKNVFFLSTNLSPLEILNREDDENVRRITIVKLSEKSKNLQKKYVEVSKKMTEVFYGALSEKEIDQFEGYLRTILNNLINAK